MRILDWTLLDRPARRAALARPELKSRGDVARITRELIERVLREGDEALKALTLRFDGARLDALAVSANEFADARRALGAEETRSPGACDR
jgi:histidinol dehydrogenase